MSTATESTVAHIVRSFTAEGVETTVYRADNDTAVVMVVGALGSLAIHVVGERTYTLTGGAWRLGWDVDSNRWAS